MELKTGELKVTTYKTGKVTKCEKTNFDNVYYVVMIDTNNNMHGFFSNVEFEINKKYNVVSHRVEKYSFGEVCVFE